MGRPTKFDQEKALDVALDYFWSKGFAGASVNELAKLMGVTRSSFYNSFGTLEAAFEAASARYTAASPDRRLDTLAPGEPVLPAIRQVLHDIAATRAADPAARGCMLVNCLTEDGDSETTRHIAESFKGKIARFERLLAQALSQGELPADTDCSVLAREIMTFMIGLNVSSRFIREAPALQHMCDSFLKAHKRIDGTQSGEQ